MKARREAKVESQEFSAVILAGGKSSRMGRDKAWLKMGGTTLLRP
jgi:molybdopterin-guanine dinucleotide biosynthesis protein A